MGISSQAPEETWEKVQRLLNGEFIVEDSMNLSKVYKNLSKHELRSAVIGMILGDASIQLRYGKSRIQMGHSPKVEDYIQVKKYVLEQIPGMWCHYKHTPHVNRKIGKTYPTIKVWTKTHQFLTKIRDRMYKPNKIVTRGVLSSLTPLGLAMWYMDDGHLSLHHNVKRYVTDSNIPSERSISTRPIILNTHGFTEEENEVIKDYFKDFWDIECKVKPERTRGLFCIYMNTTNARKFVDIVRPYVLCVPSMHHKIDFRYTKNSPELLKYNIEYWTMKNEHECVTSQVSEMVI